MHSVTDPVIVPYVSDGDEQVQSVIIVWTDEC